MRKSLKIFLLAIFTILVLSNIATRDKTAFGNPDYWVKVDNVYSELIKEPAEVMILIFAKTGLKLIVTNNEDNRVSFPFEYMEAKNLKIEDLDIVIHSHQGSAYPSLPDVNMYKFLRNRGFKGLFGICSRSSKIINWVEVLK